MIVFLAVLALGRRRTPARSLRFRCGRDNPVVAGRAVFKCGCTMAPDEITPCAAHEAMMEIDKN